MYIYIYNVTIILYMPQMKKILKRISAACERWAGPNCREWVLKGSLGGLAETWGAEEVLGSVLCTQTLKVHFSAPLPNI